MAYQPTSDEKRIITKRAAAHALKVGAVGLLLWYLLFGFSGWLETGSIWLDISLWILIAAVTGWFLAYRSSMLKEYSSKMTSMGFQSQAERGE